MPFSTQGRGGKREDVYWNDRVRQFETEDGEQVSAERVWGWAHDSNLAAREDLFARNAWLAEQSREPLVDGGRIAGYEIMEGRLSPSDGGAKVFGAIVPADAFIDGSDDPRYPPPPGYEWGEGVVVDGTQFVELLPLPWHEVQRQQRKHLGRGPVITETMRS